MIDLIIQIIRKINKLSTKYINIIKILQLLAIIIVLVTLSKYSQQTLSDIINQQYKQVEQDQIKQIFHFDLIILVQKLFFTLLASFIYILYYYLQLIYSYYQNVEQNAQNQLIEIQSQENINEESNNDNKQKKNNKDNHQQKIKEICFQIPFKYLFLLGFLYYLTISRQSQVSLQINPGLYIGWKFNAFVIILIHLNTINKQYKHKNIQLINTQSTHMENQSTRIEQQRSTKENTIKTKVYSLMRKILNSEGTSVVFFTIFMLIISLIMIKQQFKFGQYYTLYPLHSLSNQYIYLTIYGFMLRQFYLLLLKIKMEYKYVKTNSFISTLLIIFIINFTAGFIYILDGIYNGYIAQLMGYLVWNKSVIPLLVYHHISKFVIAFVLIYSFIKYQPIIYITIFGLQKHAYYLIDLIVNNNVYSKLCLYSLIFSALVILLNIKSIFCSNQQQQRDIKQNYKNRIIEQQVNLYQNNQFQQINNHDIYIEKSKENQPL